MASPSSIITLGYGNGTFAGSPSLIVTAGYGVGALTSTLVGRWSNIDTITVHTEDRTITVHAEDRYIDV